MLPKQTLITFIQMKNSTIVIVCVLIFNMFISCHKSNDGDYFDGDIQSIENSVRSVKKITLKAVPLNGANYGWIAVYDSLMIFANPKLRDNFFNVFNIDTGEEIGEFCGKGGGPDEMIAVNPIYQFFKEGDTLKTLLFAPNENKLFIWNISQSIEQEKTIMDTIISYKSRNEGGFVSYNYLFLQNEDTLFAYLPSFPLSDEEASLPFYQKRTVYTDKLLRSYNIYKKNVRNGDAAIIPETFFSSKDAFMPDSSKIVQVLYNLPQINILDTHTGQITGYRMKNSPDFSFFETGMTSRKVYYLRVQADNSRIYASYWGKEPWKRNEVPYINTIHVFDWHGKLIDELTVDHPVGEMWLDPVRNRLYTVNVSTDEVFYLDLNKFNFSE